MQNAVLMTILGLALLGYGIFKLFEMFNSANAGVQAQATTAEMQTIFSNVLNGFSNNPFNFVGFNNTGAINASIPPASWVPPGQTTNITDPWGGAVVFAADSINGGTNNGWSLTIPKVPQGQCASIGSLYTPQVAKITINTVVVAQNPSYGGVAGSWPPPAAAIQAACNVAANTVEFEVAGQ